MRALLAALLLIASLSAQLPGAGAQRPYDIMARLKAAQQAQAQYAATYGAQNITAAFVRRVAKASRPTAPVGDSGGGGIGGGNGAASIESVSASIERAVASSPLSAVEQALALGLPVNFDYLQAHPDVATRVRAAILTNYNALEFPVILAWAYLFASTTRKPTRRSLHGYASALRTTH